MREEFAPEGSRRTMDSVTAERFLNTYHNASPPPSPDVPEDLTSFMLAADRVLAEAAELARVLARAHQAAATQLIGEGWAHTRKSCSLPERYAGWADDRAPAKGYGVYAFAHQVSRPIRLTDEELRAHPEWRNFGDKAARPAGSISDETRPPKRRMVR